MKIKVESGRKNDFDYTVVLWPKVKRLLILSV